MPPTAKQRKPGAAGVLMQKRVLLTAFFLFALLSAAGFQLLSFQNLKQKPVSLKEHVGSGNRRRAHVVEKNERGDLGPEPTLEDTPEYFIMQELAKPGVWQVGSDEDYFRFKPPLESFEPPSIQVGNRVFFFGGFRGALNEVNRNIQILNLDTQSWESPAQIPETSAETHQGLAFDDKTRFIYSISGQKGGGCNPATPNSFRMHADTLEIQEIPPIPAARYNPGVAVFEGAVHVFGGSNEMRNMSALDHWVMYMDSALDAPAMTNEWVRMGYLPVSGCHGESFRYGHHLYHMGGCNVDQGVTAHMKRCHVQAVKNGLFVHHVPVPANAYRFDLSVQGATWEKVPDMPVNVCVAPALLVGRFAIFVGGASAEQQLTRGTPPRSERVVQALDLERQQWMLLAPLPSSVASALFHGSVWQHQHGDALSLHMLRTAEYRPQDRPVRRSTYLVARLAASPRLGSRASHARQRRLGLRNASHPLAWPSAAAAEQGFRKCLQEASAGVGRIVTRSDGEQYHRDRIKRNGAHHFEQYPIAIAHPEDEAGVAAVVKCAVGSGMQVCARNGRHAFEGLGCTHGVTVDMSEMQALQRVDGAELEAVHRDALKEEVEVRVGAGLRLGQVAAKAMAQGLWLPAGVCPTVGVAGLVLVGGQGMLSRRYGLTADRLVGFEMVSADGERTQVSQTQHPELLWLAKGGGSYEHFPGIITSLTFNFFEVDAHKKQWIKFKAVLEEPEKNAYQAFAFWQRWAPWHRDRGLTAEMWISKQWDGKALVYYTGLYYGSKHTFVRRWRAEVEPNVTMEMSFVAHDLKEYILDATGTENEEELTSGRHGWDAEGANWKGRSFVSEGVMRDTAALQRLAHTIWNSKARQYVELKPLGGKIREVEKTDTAFWHRTASWWALYQSFWPSDWTEEQVRESIEEGQLATQAVVASLKRQGIYGGQYVGYVDHAGAASRGEELRNYYGKNLERIQEIRADWDPSGVFRHARPVVPVAGEDALPIWSSLGVTHAEAEEQKRRQAAARKKWAANSTKGGAEE